MRLKHGCVFFSLSHQCFCNFVWVEGANNEDLIRFCGFGLQLFAQYVNVPDLNDLNRRYVLW